MLKNLISQGDFALWPQISLVIFFMFFTAVLFWVFRGGSERHYRYMAKLTQNEGEMAKEVNHGGR